MISEQDLVVDPDSDSKFAIGIVSGCSVLYWRKEYAIDPLIHPSLTIRGVWEEFEKWKYFIIQDLIDIKKSANPNIDDFEILIHPRKFTQDKRMVFFVGIIPTSVYVKPIIGGICDS